MKSQRLLMSVAAATLTLASVSLFAQPLIDGTKDASYGTALTSQTVLTQFGDATGALLGGGGGELDAFYAANSGSQLFLMFTGNLEANGNLINIFFDVVSDTAGENVLTPRAGKDSLFDTGHFGGATLPTDFNCDYIFCYKGFDNPANGTGNYDFIYVTLDVSSGTIAYPNPDVFTLATTNPMIITDNATGPLFEFGFNNSNSAGVAGGGAPPWGADNAAALAVTTGFEVAIPLSVLGAATGDQIKIFAVYSNGGADYLSNQFLPPLPTPAGNVGGPGGGYNFGSTGLNLSAATYTVVAGPSDAASWALYE